MKNWMVIFILISAIAVNATILHVALDGTQDYETVQSAINASANTDTVLVYPGRYLENIRFYGKNITLASLELTTGDISYKYSTILDGNQNGTVVQIRNDESYVTLRGFTITNGSGFYVEDYHGTFGGGVLIGSLADENQVNVINCIIAYNTAMSNAGLQASACNLSLSGTTIRNNIGQNCGGLFYQTRVTQEYHITFDPINRCNIYNNIGAMGADIFCSNTNNVEVILDTLTVMIPWNFYANALPYSSTITNPFTFDILHSVHSEINQDLFVAPYGDDNNSGLSPSEPLKNIYLAVNKIASDPENPKTVHLSEGIYSTILNNQHFPLPLKRNMKLVGSLINSTIFDLQLDQKPIICNPFSSTNFIHNINIINGDGGISAYNCETINISDVIFDNVQNASCYGLSLSNCTNVALNNIVIKNGIGGSIHGTGLDILNFRNRVDVSNLTIENCQSSDYMAGFDINSHGIGVLNMTNCKFTNLNCLDPEMINGIGQIYPNQTSTRLKINVSNCVFSDNYQVNQQTMAYFRSLNDTLSIIGCTFANNSGGSRVLNVGGNVKLTNNIFWNPAMGSEVGVPYYTSTGAFNALFRYNNIRNGLNGVWSGSTANQIIWEENNTSFDPMFALTGNEPYRLLPDSPLIDAGNPEQYFGVLTYDIAGNERMWDGDNDGIARIDMGAYEYQNINSPENLAASVSVNSVYLSWTMDLNRAISGYRVYRDSVAIADIDNPHWMEYRDTALTESDTITYRVVALYGTIESEPSNSVTVYLEYVHNDDNTVPSVSFFRISPNPFSNFTVIRFTVGDAGSGKRDGKGEALRSPVDICVYNLKGQKIKTIIKGLQAKGEQVNYWDGRDDNSTACSTGIYIVKLLLDGKAVSSKKVTLVK